MRLTCLLLIAGCTLQAETRVALETSLGKIVIALDEQHAPNTVANFLTYVKEGKYDGGAFHRTVTMRNQPDNKVKIEVIQAATRPDAQQSTPIKLERTSVTGLKHLDGTLSMARGPVDSATSDIFICIGDQPELDFGGKRNADGQGFAAFGRVVSGMEIVRKIQQSPAEGQKLTPPVAIARATICAMKSCE
jgi:peptidyl-prolyl cis-trans isomerase A (cyclophilin A)